MDTKEKLGNDTPLGLNKRTEKKLRAGNTNNLVVQDFLDYLLTVKGYSQHTLNSYKYDLVWLLRFFQLRQGKVDLDELERERKNGTSFIDYTLIDVSDITIDEIKKIRFPDLYAFIGFTARELNNSENSRKRKVTVIKRFFRFLHITQHLIDENPAEELEAPKIGRPLPRYLTLEQSQNLLDAPTGRHSVRDKAILTIFLNTGLRVSELCNIQLNDIQSEMLHVTGKGNKDRTLFLNDACLQALAEYLPIREDQIAEQHIDLDYLFISQKGTQFSTRGIEHMIEKYVKSIGLNPRTYTVHTLRHTAATLMHRYGNIDIKTLQQVLGHESTQTTEIYTHLENSEIQEAINSNPLSHYKTDKYADVSAVFNLNNKK